MPLFQFFFHITLYIRNWPIWRACGGNCLWRFFLVQNRWFDKLRSIFCTNWVSFRRSTTVLPFWLWIDRLAIYTTNFQSSKEFILVNVWSFTGLLHSSVRNNIGADFFLNCVSIDVFKTLTFNRSLIRNRARKRPVRNLICIYIDIATAEYLMILFSKWIQVVFIRILRIFVFIIIIHVVFDETFDSRIINFSKLEVQIIGFFEWVWLFVYPI